MATILNGDRILYLSVSGMSPNGIRSMNKPSRSHRMRPWVIFTDVHDVKDGYANPTGTSRRDYAWRMPPG